MVDPQGRKTPPWAWLAVAVLTLGLFAWNARTSIDRYRDLNSGWSWDLAYYNQWFWALTQGDGTLSVRPSSSYGREGLSVWRSNYLAPIRLAIAPIYAIRPGPETLLVVEAALFWLAIPAAYRLAKAESGSVGVGLIAATMVPLTPLLIPLAANDFRELQLALPFGLVAMEGVRGRRAGLAVAGVAGLLTCRQELAVVVAMLAIVPPRGPEDLGRTRRWAGRLWLAGVGWTLLFLLYLAITRSAATPGFYLDQFRGPKAPIDQTITTTADLLVVGMGAWGVLAFGVPRGGLLALFWAWTLGSGRWSLRYLGSTEWHHVRYAAPLAMTGLAAGVLGFARVMGRLTFAPARLGLVAAMLIGMIAARVEVETRFNYAPRPLPKPEVAALWRWIDEVGPDDGVLADYDVAAPLSSRRLLNSYILDLDTPRGFPQLDPSYRFVFARPSKLRPETFTNQGFEIVHRSGPIWVYRRPGPAPPPSPRPPEAILTNNSILFRWLEIIQTHFFPLAAIPCLAWPWLRLRRAWRVASGRPSETTGIEAAGPAIEVDDPPRDLADPARRAVRLAPETADGRTLAATTIAAFEAAHLGIALGPGWLARVARFRPALLIASRLATTSGGLTMAVGVTIGSQPVFAPGLTAFGAGVGLPLLMIGVEVAAARRARAEAEVDPALLAALRWRHIAEAWPIPWRSRRRHREC